jgi:protein tyrosine phosphatase
VFCLAYAVVRALASGNTAFDKVANIVLEMRSCRRNMVQTIEQYVFCYHVVLYIASQYLQNLRQVPLSVADSLIRSG